MPKPGLSTLNGSYRSAIQCLSGMDWTAETFRLRESEPLMDGIKGGLKGRVGSRCRTLGMSSESQSISNRAFKASARSMAASKRRNCE
jgi:hypothetical protein